MGIGPLPVRAVQQGGKRVHKLVSLSDGRVPETFGGRQILTAGHILYILIMI